MSAPVVIEPAADGTLRLAVLVLDLTMQGRHVESAAVLALHTLCHREGLTTLTELQAWVARSTLMPEALAELLHATYQRLALDYDARTHGAPAMPWGDVPTPQRDLMIATSEEVLRQLRGREFGEKGKGP